jgi:hypothetical protein
MQQVQDKPFLDKLGIWASGLCALHCLALPLLLPVLPFIGSLFFAQGWFEKTILSMSLIVGSWALFIGFYKYHRQMYPLYSLFVGGLIYWNKDIFGHDFEPITVAVGACLIIVAHITNMKLCKSCQSCDSGCSSSSEAG